MFASISPARWVASAILVALLASSLPVAAQVKYQPEHPEVEAMARRGVEFLAASRPADSGELVLAALAAVETSKRYDNRVPSENPLVQAAIQAIMASFNDPNPDTGILSNGSVYYPCLALILLCDVDGELYKDQIQQLVEFLEFRQLPHGAYSYESQPTKGDASQTQYCALAMWVAKHHGFHIPNDVPKNALQWYVDRQSPEGSWYYQYRGGQRDDQRLKLTLSIHAASAGTVYLLGDYLQLHPKRKRKSSVQKQVEHQLPPSVSMFVKPKTKDGQPDENAGKDGPLVTFNGGKLAEVKRKANRYFDEHFEVHDPMWSYYYLYAVERYAFFRERAEGEFSEEPRWYDKGVEYLKTKQQEHGGFIKGRAAPSTPVVATSFAVLFLVRSSEVLIMPPNTSRLTGGLGFKDDTKLSVKNGEVRSIEAIKGVEDVLTLLEEGADDDQLEQIVKSMGPAIRDFNQKSGKSRGEKSAFLRGLVTDRNYFRRLIAVKFLARQQNMDNVPALLYALGDPDLRICQEAHDGLRLISRKIDSVTIPDKPDRSDFNTVKKEWTAWYKKIRPGAELLD